MYASQLTFTILSLSTSDSNLQHVHSVAGKRPPYAVHDRPDKYTKLRQHYNGVKY